MGSVMVNQQSVVAAGPWHTFTQDDLVIYSNLTLDENPLHLDPEFAATTIMGRPVAHGTLSLSLVWRLMAQDGRDHPPGNTTLSIRYLVPVYVDEKIRAEKLVDSSGLTSYRIVKANGQTAVAVALPEQQTPQVAA